MTSGGFESNQSRRRFPLSKKEGCKDDEALCLLEKVYEVLSYNLKNECEYLENKLNYKVVPIRDLVRIQIECGLIVARRRQKKEY